MQPEIRKPTEQERQIAQAWPIWTKEVSEFPWEYDEQETCLILAGQVTITNETGQKFDFAGGDSVVFPRGMRCTWQIKQPVRKHYQFG